MTSPEALNAVTAAAPSLVIDRLRRRDVPRVICQWIAAWLSERTARVRMCGRYGRAFALPWGYPKGSFLGPILWYAFVDPLLANLDRRCVSRRALGGTGFRFTRHGKTNGSAT
jgi:hypothetical protein